MDFDILTYSLNFFDGTKNGFKSMTTMYLSDSTMDKNIWKENAWITTSSPADKKYSSTLPTN